MSDRYYNDLREFIDVLDNRGLLYRWQRPVNKDSELMPLMRLQYRGRSDAERQAFLYENVTDGQGRRYGVQGSHRSLWSFAYYRRPGHGL